VALLCTLLAVGVLVALWRFSRWQIAGLSESGPGEPISPGPPAPAASLTVKPTQQSPS
jgi:hypothetical protein